MTLLVDSGLYPKEVFGASFEFLLSQGLVEVKEYLKSYKVVFVGEVLTPHHHFIALPKNFVKLDEENVLLTMALLKTFKNLRKAGKLLIANKSFHIGQEIESTYYYWGKLYGYFMDYITYGFYYPKKRKMVHSIRPRSGKINPLLTDINRDRYGSGMSYELKVFAADPVRDLYYSVLKELERSFASPIEQRKIEEMEKFLSAKGMVFREVEYDIDGAIGLLRSTQHAALHEPIAKTLLNYLLCSKIKEKNTINAFYSKSFEYVYQIMLQSAFGHDRFLRTTDWSSPSYKTLEPDLITPRFIGDAKYYRLENLLQKPFEKELYAYNVANGNRQPNVVLVPAEENVFVDTLSHGPYSLSLISVKLMDVFDDFRSGQKNTLGYVLSVIDTGSE